ncbi:ribbon-helix-helix protein, CopG family [Actinomycetospora sp. TBRC 11914]|uniref:ribbon-helix-helix protein, CopG family n=1 Tax=Actinomycetospora sp. TBRC 11914 TaxID=2729387 RepID=UPI00145F0A67|nr:ribbon-helix-helix protein, CopG family [Actinomycetospora sp. TBRC 11914]NMO90408.1 ribbon-helix-helix protein, CopG family [Actinomycetospora sp. TBRC 11914]
MRTTITIDDGLLAQVRRRAAELGQTVSQVIEDSVREKLLRRDDQEAAGFRVRAFRGGRLRPGVDLDDNGALLEVLDER